MQQLQKNAIKLRTECQKKRENWKRWIFLDLPEGLYPEYDGATHECRINDALKPYFANICIEYKLHSETGGEPKLQSLDQLKALIEQGIVMAVLKVKRGFREYTLDLDHVYDSKKDRSVYETELHSVLLIGYRSNSQQTHLLIQNPWLLRETVPWGEKGYAWVAVHSITTMELNDQIYTLVVIPPPMNFSSNLFM
uniref:Peptidase C1A papain C-terminal domain-containing protein n=1 Tax=Globodera rostochiensis TaxID=31243 RepID=A0A914HKX4_GLORO